MPASAPTWEKNCEEEADEHVFGSLSTTIWNFLSGAWVQNVMNGFVKKTQRNVSEPHLCLFACKQP